MARAIDVDRVKREIRKNKEKIVISCKQKYVPLSLIYEILNKAPTLTPPNEWVSVYDRLPEPGERVLATDCGFVGEFYINERGQWQRYNVNCHALLMALDILYWMPLPKSPKEDQK